MVITTKPNSGKPSPAKAELEQRILNSREVQGLLGKLTAGSERSQYPEIIDWEAKAREFASAVSSTRESEFVTRTNNQAAKFVADSFSSVHVRGLDGIVLQRLREGRVIVFRNHQSYAGVVVDKDVYARNGIGDMTFIAGSNIVNMTNRKMAAAWREQLTRSGVKLIERDPPKGKEGLLYFTVLGASLAIDISGGSNITIYGDGREKDGKESNLKTALIRFFLEHGHFILPVAESYEVVPDDSELANASSRKKVEGGGASFDILLKLKRMPEFGQAPYGEVYLNFGEPFQTSEYGPDTHSMRNCEAKARERATQLVVLSSTYLLAAAVKNSGLAEFDVGQATNLVGSLLEKIRERNAEYAKNNAIARVFIAPKLAEDSLSDVVRDAAEKLVSRRASVNSNNRIYSAGDSAMLNFYAAKGDAPLRAHGILLAEKT